MPNWYEENNLEPQIILELYEKNGKVEVRKGIGHTGSSREGEPFNLYEPNLKLVIECRDDEHAWKLLSLLMRAKFHLPTDLQKANPIRTKINSR